MTQSAKSLDFGQRWGVSFQTTANFPEISRFNHFSNSLSLQKKSLGEQLFPWVITALGVGAAVLAYMIYLQKPETMATEFQTTEAIDTATSMGDLSVENLESQGPEMGLLTQGDKAKDVLHHQWKVISKLGITHSNIANILDRILNVAGQKYFMKFSPSELKSSVIFSDLPDQHLLVTKDLCKGYVPRCPLGSVKDWCFSDICWKSTITNSLTNQTIDIDRKMIPLIKRFGFYGNGTRGTDPLQLVSVLSGLAPRVLQKIVK